MREVDDIKRDLGPGWGKFTHSTTLTGDLDDHVEISAKPGVVVLRIFHGNNRLERARLSIPVEVADELITLLKSARKAAVAMDEDTKKEDAT